MKGKKPKFFLTTTIPPSLGFFVGQYDYLQQTFDVTVISSQRKQLVEFGDKEKLKVNFIPMSRGISLAKDIWGLICFVFYFIRQRPYIVHGNTPKAGLLSMCAAWLTRVPVRIYMCHGLRYQGAVGFKRNLLMFMERISCHCATDIVCVSNGIKRVLTEDKITKKNPVVIWNGSVNGIDVKKFNPDNNFDKQGLRKKYGLLDDNYVLTFIGRIVKDKGIDELVEAFKVLSPQHPEMRLLLIGSIEMEENPVSMQTQEEMRYNNNIIYTGYQSDVASFLAISDIFIFPSYREGFGLSLMEACAMEIPSIASDVIGCNEVLENGETGILVPSHSSKAIVDAVEKLYTDKTYYSLLKSQCRKSVINRYEQTKLWNEYSDYYKSKIK